MQQFTRPLHRRSIALVVYSVTECLKQGALPEWSSKSKRLQQRLERNFLALIWGALGDRVNPSNRWNVTVKVATQWLFGLMRQDQQLALGLRDIPENAWTQQTSWRPFIALASVTGLISIPDFRTIYYRRPNESAIENICGLWAIGQSTGYRYIEKGRKIAINTLEKALNDGEKLWGLRDFSDNIYDAMNPTHKNNDKHQWHKIQAIHRLQLGYPSDTIWHLYKAEDWTEISKLLSTRTLEICTTKDIECFLNILNRENYPPLLKIDLSIAESLYWRCRGDSQKELDCLYLALKTSEVMPPPLKSIGSATALYAKAYFDVAREPDSAIAKLEKASLMFLEASNLPEEPLRIRAQNGFIMTNALLAYVHLRRGNPIASILIRNAETARRSCIEVYPEADGMLLKARSWSARCNNAMEDAINLRLQVLSIFESSSNQREIIDANLNIGILYLQVGNFSSAERYLAAVLNASAIFPISPETMLSALGTIGVVQMAKGDSDNAIKYIIKSLSISRQYKLLQHEATSLLNLAEIYFIRFKSSGNCDDEISGDLYLKEGTKIADALDLEQYKDKAATLKDTVLNPKTALSTLVPPEQAAHAQEFVEIQKLRLEMAVPRPPTQRARTHIALSQLYLRIAAKERDAARGLMQTHGLSDLESELEALQQTWAHDGNLASQLNQRWREQVGDWLTEAQRKAVLARLLEEGSLSKSSYGEAAEVSPATASKHLGLLADKGLLEQQGRGPATRYVLPAAASSGGAPAAPPVH